MGSQLETIKDSEGNNHVIFDESSLFDDSQMGDKLEDFEILQVLSEKNNNNGCFVAKVRSLNNHKIYALKKIQSNMVGDNLINHMNNLQQLNNPHILKYYKFFLDNCNNLYLIMEFMNNDDIFGFIKAHQILNKRIKEEEIWNILLQCSSALDYLHNQNLGFKLTNIFMNNEQNAKIAVFNDFSDYNQNYNPNYDIFILGKYFYVMCFSQEKAMKTIESIDQLQIGNNVNQFYSNELMNIIFQMLNGQQNMLNSNNLYNIIKKEYVKKYARNTSINSVLRCLYAFPRLNNVIFQKENLFESNTSKYYINYWFLKTIKILSGKENTNLNECVEEFRRAIASENSKLDGNREIDPIYLLSFLLEKMHKEANKKNNDGAYLNENSNKALFNGEEEDATNKDQMLFKYLTYFKDNISSPISDLFFGCLKTKRNCQTCKTGNYSFSTFCFVIFDLTKNNSEEFDLIENGFKYQHNTPKTLNPNGTEKIFCKRCLTYQEHLEFNRYYLMNRQLIIGFIRGNNYQNNTKINFEENLDLEKYLEEKNLSPKKYNLVGSINMINTNGKEEFVYFCRDLANSANWHTTNNQSGNNSDIVVNYSNNNIINDIRNNGKVILLFYNTVDNI